MPTKGKNSQEILRKQITLQYMKNLLEHLQDDASMKEKKNYSFIYLEGDSLSMLLMYLISLSNHSHPILADNADYFPIEALNELNKTLDEVLEKNKYEFESLITLLKDNRDK